MHLFFAPEAFLHQQCALAEQELHHMHVLRMKNGDALRVFNGIGSLFSARLDVLTKKEALVTITELLNSDSGVSSPALHIAIALPKNIDRFEWFVEKACEIGVKEITPIICRNSERKEMRIERVEKVIVAACKQSLKYTLPKLHEIVTLKQFLSDSRPSELKYIAYCSESANHLKLSYQKGRDAVVLVGPEGDFTPTEVEEASSAGYLPVSLGSSRLRMETAGVFVAAIFNLQNEYE